MSCLLAVGRITGLKNLDPKIQQGFEQSQAGALLTAPVRWLRGRLAPLAEHSLTRQYLPQINFLMVLLLLFTLPFVETRESGLIVLATSALTFLRLLLIDEDYPLGSLVAIVFFFVAWGLVGSAFSPFLKLSLLGFAKLLTYFLTYLCFLVNLRSMTQVRLSAWVIISSALIVSVYGLYQWHIKVPPLALWDDPDSNYKITRVYSFLGNPNLLGGYLLPTIAISCFFYFGNVGWRKLLILGAFGAQVLCLYWTYSRGAWIALALGAGMAFVLCLLIFWQKFAKNPILKSLLFAGLGIGLLGTLWFVMHNPALVERINSLFSGREHSSNNFRVNVWVSSLHIIREYGWTGVGLGNKVFQKIYTYYMATGFQALSTYNVFLEVWLEMGIVGLLSFMALLVTHLGRCLWGIVQDIDLNVRLFLAAAACGLVAMMVHGMVDTVFYRPSVQILFWYFLALITIVSQENIAFGNQSSSELKSGRTVPAPDL